MDTPERIAKLEAQVESIKEDVTDLKTDVKEIHSRITTGNREILDKIGSMEDRIERRMEESAASAAKQHNEIQVEIQKDIKEITTRVDVLERWRWMIVGGAIALGYAAGHSELFAKLFN